MTDETHNGWTNWETWEVECWVSNDTLDYTRIQAMAEFQAEEVVEDEVTKRQATDALASGIQEMVESRAAISAVFSSNDGLAKSLMSAVLGAVNWTEIAEVYLEEAIDDLLNAE